MFPGPDTPFEALLHFYGFLSFWIQLRNPIVYLKQSWKEKTEDKSLYLQIQGFLKSQQMMDRSIHDFWAWVVCQIIGVTLVWAEEIYNFLSHRWSQENDLAVHVPWFG